MIADRSSVALNSFVTIAGGGGVHPGGRVGAIFEFSISSLFFPPISTPIGAF